MKLFIILLLLSLATTASATVDKTNVKFGGDIYDSDTGTTLNEPPPPPIPTVTTPGKGTLLLLGIYLIMFFLAPKHTLLLVFFSVPVILLFHAIKPLIF